MILTLLTGTTRRLDILIFARACSHRVEFTLPSQSAQSEFFFPIRIYRQTFHNYFFSPT